MKRKIVEERLNKFGFTINQLGKKFYTNEKISVKCKNNHEISMFLGNIVTGNGCSICSYEKRKLKQITKKQAEKKYNITIININQSIGDNYLLNTMTTYKITCNKCDNERGLLMYTAMNGKYVCNGCAIKKKVVEMKENIKKRGYTIVGGEDKNLTSKNTLIIKCSNGHEMPYNHGNFSRGRDCGVCYKEGLISHAKKDRNA